MLSIEDKLNNNLKLSNKNNIDVVDFKIMFFASIIAVLNVLFSYNYYVSIIIVVFELIVLAYYFAKNKITKYIGNYLIFLCLSFEFEVLAGANQIYGFKNFRIFGVNLGIIVLIPIFLKLLFKGVKIKEIKKASSSLYKFVSALIFLNVTGFIIGLFQILVNDNNIQGMEGVLNDFVATIYTMILAPFLLIASILYLISWEKEELFKLNDYLVAILIGIVISMIASLITGVSGWYGGVSTLLVTSVMGYIPFMLLFTSYDKYKSKKFIFIFGLIGAILSLIYNASGKLILLYILIPIGMLGVLWKQKKRIKVLTMAIIIIPLIIITIKGLDSLTISSILFRSKFNQAISMLTFWEKNWILNMPLSPRVRIIEFLNIIYEYFTKPWYLILGKGYMGTIIDHTGMLGPSIIPGSYSVNQWNNGTFYRVHETLNVLFLYNGLLGIGMYIYMISMVLKKYAKSPWILIGGYWFIMLYGFSMTMSAFGIVALFLGYLEVENKI